MKLKIIFGLFILIASSLWLTSCAKKPAATAANDVDYYTCTMHPSVHSKTPGKCPICGMDLVPVYKTSAATNAPATQNTNLTATQTLGRKIKFYQSTMNPRETSSTPAKDSMGMEMTPVYEEAFAENQPGQFTVPLERQQQIGVTYATVEKMPVIFSIRAVGTVASEITRRHDFIAPAQGSVISLDVKSPGEIVEQDQPLLTIYSSGLLADEKNFADEVASYVVTPQTGTTRMIQNINEQFEAAKNRLRLWNLTTNQIAELEKWTTRVPHDTATIRAPFGGVIQRIGVEPGKIFGAGDELLELTDLRAVWVWADFYQDELPLLKVGLPVDITTSTFPGEIFSGKIAVVDPFLNPATRTVRVRIDLENPDLKLRPEMYVNVELKIDDGESLAVPVNAVLPTGEHNIVFVDKGDGKLEPRFIQLGRQFGNFYEVKSGLSEGERVVDSANFLIDAESQIQGALKSW
jgi:multidrug efflux pump subunit AcrA (membrane-fusion protein)